MRKILAILMVLLTFFTLVGCEKSNAILEEERAEYARQEYEYNLYKSMKTNKNLERDFLNGKIDFDEFLYKIKCLDKSIQENNVKAGLPKNKFQMLNTISASSLKTTKEFKASIVYTKNIEEKVDGKNVEYAIKDNNKVAYIVKATEEGKHTFVKIYVLS